MNEKLAEHTRHYLIPGRSSGSLQRNSVDYHGAPYVADPIRGNDGIASLPTTRRQERRTASAPSVATFYPVTTSRGQVGYGVRLWKSYRATITYLLMVMILIVVVAVL